MKQSEKSNTSYGFTIIEKVAGVALLIILAAYVYGFLQPRVGDQESACESNEKIIGLAFTQYLEDNDNKFPTGIGPNGTGWSGQIYPYVKSDAVFRCPADSATSIFAKAPISYAMNRNL